MNSDSRLLVNENQRLLAWSRFGIVLLVAFLTAKTFILIHASNFYALSGVAQGVLAHKPHWIAYQNRLLGPYIVYGITLLGLSFRKALIGFSVLAIIYQTTLVYLLLLNLTKNNFSLSIRYTIYFSFMFIGIQHYWFYTWDNLEIILFIFFSWGIWAKKNTTYFVVLFFAALANKESAIFIAVFLMIDASFIRWGKNKKKLKIGWENKAKFLVGAGLTIVGMVYTKLLRDYLFISSSLPTIGYDETHKTLGNHFNLVENIQAFFFKNLLSQNIISTFLIIGLVLYLTWSFKNFQEQDYKAVTIIVLILMSIFFFGLVNESRIYSPLLPLVLFLHLSLSKQLAYHT